MLNTQINYFLIQTNKIPSAELEKEYIKPKLVSVLVPTLSSNGGQTAFKWKSLETKTTHIEILRG